MRRRITIAMVSVLAIALALTTLGSLVLVHRAATSSTEDELTGEAYAIASGIDSASTHPRLDTRAALRLLARVGNFADVELLVLTPSGTFLPGLPAPFSPANVDTPAIEADRAVSGNVGQIVFSAVPLSLDARARSAFGGIPPADLPVLFVARRVPSPVSGSAYFALVALGALVVATIVAAFLGGRISSPLTRAVDTTTAIASGDLSARVEVSPGDYPELAALARSINAMGDSLVEAKGLERQFLMSVSHDLRTPLTAIRGYAEAIADGASDDPAAAAAVIIEASARLERLVQDLLDLARLDAKRFSLEIRGTDAVEVARSVVQRFSPKARALHVSLDGTLPDSPVEVRADPDRLAQVISNLLENALDFASSRVLVGVGAAETHCAIWVDDDGPGIAPEDLSRVFDRHFSADRTSRRAIRSGLGLAIVAELVAAMEGQVRAESPTPSGEGTRMVVWMPRSRPSSPLPPPVALSRGTADP